MSTASNADAAYRRLREAIAGSRYPAGARLTEVGLADELGMSRTPVREALRRLQADGLLEPAGRGVVVAALAPEEVQDLYAVRAALEALAGELAATRQAAGEVAPARLDELDRRVAAFDAAAAGDDVAELARTNLALHGLIAELAGNRFLSDALGRIRDQIAISSVANLVDRRWLDAVREQHAAIARAIRAGDAVQAGAILRMHVLDAAAVHRRQHETPTPR